MGQILTIKVVPDLFLSFPKLRPKAHNARASGKEDLPPAYGQHEKQSKLKPQTANRVFLSKRKRMETRASVTPREPKFYEKKRRTPHPRVTRHDLDRWRFHKAKPTFEFFPTSLPTTPPPEYVSVKPAPKAEKVLAVGVAASSQSAAIGVEGQAWRPHHQWTPAAVTMVLLWLIATSMLFTPTPEAIKCISMFGVVVGTCIRHMYLESQQDDGQPYPWI